MCTKLPIQAVYMHKDGKSELLYLIERNLLTENSCLTRLKYSKNAYLYRFRDDKMSSCITISTVIQAQ